LAKKKLTTPHEAVGEGIDEVTTTTESIELLNPEINPGKYEHPC
jgi:hypothetical protein